MLRDSARRPMKSTFPAPRARFSCFRFPVSSLLFPSSARAISYRRHVQQESSTTALRQRFRASAREAIRFATISAHSIRAYDPATMWLFDASNRRRSDRATSDLLERIQRLEREQAALRARLESERQLRILAAQIVAAAQVAPVIGDAVEKFAQAMRAPLPRGRAGGLARARSAWRYLDGSFMPDSEKFEASLLEYERYAAGGRARAAQARRMRDGTFKSTVELDR